MRLFDHRPKHYLDYITTGAAVAAAVGAALATIFTYRQVQIAKETEENQIRAYIGLLPALDISFDTDRPTMPFMIHAKVKNFGQTPATNVVVAENWAWRKKGEDTTKVCSFLNPIGTSLIPLHPGAHELFFQGQEDNLNFEIAQGETKEMKLAMLTHQEGALYISIVVQYKDIFGNSHQTIVNKMNSSAPFELEKHYTGRTTLSFPEEWAAIPLCNDSML
jgi:hypothetical protein